MTKNNQNNDGGYYAIKGFVYQIDKTILEILNNPDSEINFEQNQDIDFDDFVIQVKYKEKAKYYPSQIKEPVIQLLELFNDDNTKKYHLYAYFKDKPEECKKITLAELNKILGGNDKFNTSLKNSFISNFTLNFSQNFDEHFENVIGKIKTELSCPSDEEAIFAHGVILDHLFRKIINSPEEKITKRNSSKTELQSLLNENKKCVFYSAYREFLGDQKYFALIKKKYFTWRTIDDYERFIIVELKGNETVEELKSLAISFKNKFYKSQTRGIKSGAPFLYFINIAAENLQSIKNNLNNENHLLKDGHDFLNAEFSSKFLKEPATLENKICLKFLNTEENFQEMLNEDLGKTKEIYQFFLNKPVEFNSYNKNVKIQIQNLSDISSIL